MASRGAINTGKTKPRGPATPGIRASFVPGSKPPTLKSPPLPNPMTGSMRIQPGAPNNTNYGKSTVSANPFSGGIGA